VYVGRRHFVRTVLCCSDTNTFDYLREVPMQLVSSLYTHTGRTSNDCLLILSMEYGANFSEPGADHFAPDRAKTTVDEAHASRFLHPV
jgi:hypothetical protein